MDGLLAVLLFIVAFMVGWAMSAPEGYEDDNGFHYGKPDDRS